MEGGTGWTGDDDDDNTKNGLDTTSLNLLANRHGNLKNASTDQNLSDILLQIKSSKPPIRPHIFSPVFISNPLNCFMGRLILHLIVLGFLSFLNSLQAVINYGATWCRVCSQILPALCKLSNSLPKLSFVYADIDECPETTQRIRYTPTFHFYRDGEKVDEMFGAGEERLHDRLWLHS